MDGDYYGDEELYESEEEIDYEGSESAAPVGAAERDEEGDDEWDNAADWEAASSLPAPTWERIEQSLKEVVDTGRDDLTILVVGGVGSGSSSTVNSLLGETAADVKASPAGVAPQAPHAGVYLRRLADKNLLLRVIDCPHLVTSDTVDSAALDELTKLPAAQRIDVLLYTDRLDVFRVQPVDRQIWGTIRDAFGKEVWSRAVVCLTHGGMACPPSTTFSEIVASRSAQVSAALRRFGAPASLPFCVIDNSSRCSKNKDEEKLLPDGSVWLPVLWDEIARRAKEQLEPLSMRQELPNPNRKRLWLLPLLAGVQFLICRLLTRAIDEDSWKGDKNGEYDAETQREQRLLAQARQMHAREEGRLRDKVGRRADAEVATSQDAADLDYDDE